MGFGIHFFIKLGENFPSNYIATLILMNAASQLSDQNVSVLPN